MSAYLPELTPWFVCALAVFTGAILQRISGAGFGMIAAPVMALVAPAWLPGTVLLLGLVVGLGAIVSTGGAVDRRDLPAGFAGRTLGAIIAAFIAAAVVGTPALPIIVALIVLFAVALNLAGLHLPITQPALFGAGAIAGVMGTLTGIGAPPMAILYSAVEPRRSAATQNTFFGFGMFVSITTLAFAGLIGLKHIAFALSLAPIVPLALWAARPLAARVERGSIRPWALGLATLSAIILLSKNL
ncbi:TSUP family transporter [Lentibacter algarum]|uniref:TSUP family transporter n=1 Tax=Lentibacter algarum TaxID=576131 RepID=UPI001C07B7E2|nr:TSUP family transporter [Lentibacter algarum]MBU2981629.1 TSUP family transporter [Lentibacter algarum]